MITNPEERETYLRRYAPELLATADPGLRRARVAVLNLRHRESRTDVILMVRPHDAGSGEKPFQIGFTLDFTGLGQDTPPRPPAAFFRRESKEQSWQPLKPAPEPPPETTPEPSSRPTPVPPPAFPFTTTAGQILATLLILIGLWTSAPLLGEVLLGASSHFWGPAELTGTEKGWGFTNPADGSRIELYERPLTLARERRPVQGYAECFRGIGVWMQLRERPSFIRVNPWNPHRSVLIPGIPPESAGLLFLSASLLLAGLRLRTDIRRTVAAGASSLRHYYFSGSPPPFLVIPLVHLGGFTLYTALAVCWSHLATFPMPGFPVLTLLAVMAWVELTPGLWSRLYSMPRVRWLLLQLLLLALLPVGIAIAGFGLPFALTILTIFLLLAVAGSVFAPAYLPQNLTRLIWLPVYLAGIGAAFRAMALLAYILMPVVRVPYHQPVELLGNVAWVARFDVFVGIAGVVVVLGTTMIDTFWRLRQVRQLENLPTSRAASAAVGIAEFSGVARSLPEAAERILYFESSAGPLVSQFYLEDDSGRILVDPDGAVFRSGRATSLTGRINEIVLTRRFTPAQINRPMTMELRDGDPVYLIGNVMTAENGERLVKPLVEPGVTDPFLRLMLGKTSLPPARDIQHVFFLSDTDETAARRHIVGGIKEIWVKGLVCVALALFLVSYQLPRAGEGTGHWTLSEVLTAPLEPAKRMEMIAGYLLGESEQHRTSRGLWLRKVPYAATLLEIKDLREQVDLGNYLWNEVKGPKYRHVSPQLMRLARSCPDRMLRRYAVWALGKVGAPPDEALPVLLEILASDQFPDLRATAAHALAEVAPEARQDTVAALVAATDDRETAVITSALWALRTLKRLQAGDGLPERIIPFLEHEDKQVRHEAANVLSRLGAEALPALDALMKAATDGESIVRNSAIVAIGDIGPAAAAAVPLLIEALHDEKQGARQFAATSLGRIGPAARAAIPALREAAVNDKNTWVRQEAERALKRIAPANGAAGP